MPPPTRLLEALLREHLAKAAVRLSECGGPELKIKVILDFAN
jgi:hypothetical protein